MILSEGFDELRCSVFRCNQDYCYLYYYAKDELYHNLLLLHERV